VDDYNVVFTQASQRFLNLLRHLFRCGFVGSPPTDSTCDNFKALFGKALSLPQGMTTSNEQEF
jgi:hypothetical protein